MIPAIAQSIIGAKIVKVASTPTSNYLTHDDTPEDMLPLIAGNTPTDTYTPGGEVFLQLDNGLVLRCWNSEWGGVAVLDKLNPCDQVALKFVEDAK